MNHIAKLNIDFPKPCKKKTQALTNEFILLVFVRPCSVASMPPNNEQEHLAWMTGTYHVKILPNSGYFLPLKTARYWFKRIMSPANFIFLRGSILATYLFIIIFYNFFELLSFISNKIWRYVRRVICLYDQPLHAGKRSYLKLVTKHAN